MFFTTKEKIAILKRAKKNLKTHSFLCTEIGEAIFDLSTHRKDYFRDLIIKGGNSIITYTI